MRRSQPWGKIEEAGLEEGVLAEIVTLARILPQAGKDASVPSREGDKTSGNRRDAPWAMGHGVGATTLC